MMSFLFSDNNWLFTIALGIAGSLVMVEAIGLLLGVKILSLTPSNQDSFQTRHSQVISQNLPIVRWSLPFFCLFGLSGYLINYLLSATQTSLISPWLIVLLSLVFSLIVIMRAYKTLAKRLIKPHRTTRFL